MSSVLHEPHISPTALARQTRTEESSRGVHAATIIRWITRGVRVKGQVIKLEALRLGGRWVTSTQALDRFMARLTAASAGEASQAVETLAAEDKRVDRELSGQGW